ncbi:hypothetical protein Tco_0276487 [Tanacetum coccineum]
MRIIAASAIAIFFYSSNESVGSPPSQVILFGDIPTIIPSTSVVALEISTIAPVILSAAPVVETTLIASPTGLSISPFLCTDSSEAPDSSDGPPSQDPYVAIVARWRSRGYKTTVHHHHLSILLLLLLPPNGFANDHHPSSSSSSSDSLPVYSSGLDASDQAHSGSSTRDVPPRLCYPPRRAPRHNTAFRCWCATLLSTFYPPTTSESSLGYSSERTPCISSSICWDISQEIDSYSSEARIEEDTEIDPIETDADIELGIGDGDDVRDHVEIDPRDVRDDTEEYEADASARNTVKVGIDPISALIVEEEIVEPTGEDSSVSSGTRDDIRRLEADQLIARRQRVSMIERIDSLRLENLKVRAMLDIERDRVNSLRLHMSLSQEEFRQVRRDRDDTRGRLRSLETMTNTHSGMTHAAIKEMINQRVDAALEALWVNQDLKLGNGNENGNGDGNGNENFRNDDAYALSWRHPFNIDLMPIELGSFDVIIGMDWLAKNHAVIVCDEKITKEEHDAHLRINFGVAQEGRIVRQVLKVRLLAVEGLASYYEDLSSFLQMQAYDELTQKSVKFNWVKKEETAFPDIEA